MNNIINKLNFLLLLFTLSFTCANATIITVDNKDTSGADFTNLQEAIDAAAIGDTLYIAGSPTTYAGNNGSTIIINKRLVLFGEGYNVQQDQTGFTTRLTSILLDFIVAPSQDPSGTYFEGMFISSLSADTEVNSVRFERNEIGSVSFSGSSWLFRHNIIQNGLSGGGTTAGVNNNVTITNNIFRFGGVSSFSRTTVLITNNIFLGSNSNAISSNDFTIISNNIFYNSLIGTTTSNCDRCTFSNNLSFGNDVQPFAYANNSFGNNLEETDPQFVNAIDFSFEFTDDYRLQDSSPARGAGSDGTDIGIYGGATPFPISIDEPGFTTSILPRIPRVTEFNIQNANIPENGTLQVNFKAKTSN